MRWLLPLLVVVAISAAPAQASSCRNLKVPDGTRAALKKAHGHRDGSIAPGSIYYGACGTTHYAIATFSKALADQPEKFARKRGKGWKDYGDGFEDGCGSAAYPIPAALVHLWGFCKG
jgi:hypothetical protein